MKYVCDACERLVEAATFRVEGGGLALVCPRCQGESRVGPSGRPELRVASPAEAAPMRPVVVPMAPRPSEVRPPSPQQQEAAEPEQVVVVPAGERCPKCATAKRGLEACAKCGLVFDLYKPEEDVIPHSARREFARLLEEWGQPSAQKLMDAVGPNEVALLARMCRHHLADFPTDSRAQGILDQLTARSLVLATAAAKSESLGEANSGGSRKVVLALAIAAVLVGVLILFTFFKTAE